MKLFKLLLLVLVLQGCGENSDTAGNAAAPAAKAAQQAGIHGKYVEANPLYKTEQPMQVEITNDRLRINGALFTITELSSTTMKVKFISYTPQAELALKAIGILEDCVKMNQEITAINYNYSEEVLTIDYGGKHSYKKI